MRRTKILKGTLTIIAVAVIAGTFPNATGFLQAKDSDQPTGTGVSYSDQTGLFLKMDEDGNTSYVEPELAGTEEDTTLPEEKDDSVTFDVEVKAKDGKSANAGSFDTLDQAVHSADIIKKTRSMMRSANGDVDVAVYSDDMLRATTKPSIVRFRNTGSTISYTEVGTGISGYTSADYAADGAYLGTENGKVKFKMAGVTGLVSSGNVEIIEYKDTLNLSYYKVSGGNLFHYISTNVNGSSPYSAQRIGKAPSYLKPGTKYYSYDGHYFYTSYATMITDYKNGNYNNAVNKAAPFYNYYQFLSMRSQTSFTAANLNTRVTQKTSKTTSKLRNSGSNFINAQKYGVNAALAFGLAVNESGWGNSSIAQNKNNIFGLNAVDSSPGTSADTFSSVSVCITDFAKNWVSLGYVSPMDWRYYGPHFGDKQSGMNVQYASDPYWGEKAAAQGYYLEDLSGKKDSEKYTVAINTGSTPVWIYKDASTSSEQLYRNGNANGKGIKQFPYVVIDTVKNSQGTWYKIRTDGILKSDRSALASVKRNSGVYDFTYNYAYIKADSNIILIKNSSDSEAPSDDYLPGDVNGDGYVSSKDYNAIRNHITKKKTLTGEALKRADVNEDGYVSSKDYNAIRNHITGKKKLF